MATILVVACALTGCSKRRAIAPDCPWPPTGVTVGDSLMRRLQKAADGGSPAAILEPMTDTLGQLARLHPGNPMLNARVSYWRARCLFKAAQGNAARDTVMNAMARLDSATYTYDYFKLRSELERTHTSPALQFRTAQENVAYFRAVGDSLSVAHSLLSLGFMYLRTNDSIHALDAFSNAGEIWRTHQMPDHYTKNLINVALSSPRDRQLEIWDTLALSKIIQADTIAYETVLRNLADKAPARQALRHSRRALNLIGKHPRYRHRAALHYCAMAANLTDTAPELALAMARKALSLYSHEASAADRACVFETMAQAYDAAGHPDSALAYTRRLRATVDNENDHALALSIEAGRHALAEANLKNHIAKQRQQGTWMMVLLGVVIIAAGSLFVLYRRRLELETRQKMSQAELRATQSRLARETLLFEEKERMLETLQHQVEEAVAHGEISSVNASKILTTLKVHAAGREERQAFLDIYNHLLPSFSKRIKHDFPAITEGQIKLAAYIGNGMSNVSIAKLLNINVASVRTNRYRLRMRFNLAADQSLEDFIRRYSAPEQ